MACFYNSPELAQFMKSKTTGCSETSHANRKHAPPVMKNKKLMKGKLFIAEY
jgi:hypothetical protein